jgi:diguanylate cyclase (GGDEF)-like protein
MSLDSASSLAVSPPLLASALAQAAAALLIAFVLLAFHRQFRRGYLVYWGWSWAALCLSMAASVVAARSATGATRLLSSSVSSAAGYLQVLLAVLGAYELATGARVSSRLGRLLLTITAIAGLGTPLVFAWMSGRHSPSDLIDLAVRSSVAAVGFIASALMLLSRGGEKRPIGSRLVGAAFLLLGIQKAQYGLLAGLRLEGAFWPVPAEYLGSIDAFLQWAMGLGMVVGLLEEERRGAAQAAALMEHQAFHDALTGLPNRQLFIDRLQLALVQAHREKTGVAVLVLDLDRFKVINESLGHSRGETMLRSVAQRLQTAVREGDTVARLGGDEFILLLPKVRQPADAARIAHKLVEGVRSPFHLDGEELFITTSVGVSLYPEDGTDAETLMKHCDVAMYRAKEVGRNNFQLYTAAMNPKARERLALESSLHKALARNELVVHYQPLVDMNSGLVHGSEALLRWRHPERGLLYPRDFMDLAELTGLITPIGAWVLETACVQTRAWQERGHPELLIAVNLSARQFQQPDLADQVRRALGRSGLNGRYLELEITESLAMNKAEATINTLRELKELGVRISIDDFGTGYSSLGYLKRFPIDTLKIDQSFVRDIHADPGDAAIATTVIAMARSLGLRVVAEGVEREEQFSFLQAQHCDQVQGFLFSRPVAAEEFEALLEVGPLGPPMRPRGSGEGPAPG